MVNSNEAKGDKGLMETILRSINRSMLVLSGGMAWCGVVFLIAFNDHAYCLTNEELTISLKQEINTSTNAPAETILFDSFNNTLGNDPDSLSQGQDGVVYGLCGNIGDLDSYGFVFMINSNGSANPLVEVSLEPTSLIQGKDGLLYGTTLQGGVNGGGYGNGTIYRFNPNDNSYQILYEFTGVNGDGAWPKYLMQGIDGAHYGATDGGGIYAPFGTNNTYGTSFETGTIFTIGTGSSNYNILHSFDYTNGGSPYYLFQSSSGMLYGFTSDGGSNNDGVIFSINTNGSSYSVLYTLSSGSPGFPTDIIQGQDGAFYGTAAGGSDNDGLVFTVNTNWQNYNILYSFTGTNGDGCYPGTIIQNSNGQLYGITLEGGTIPGGYGTIFSISTNGNNYQVLYSFNGPPNDGSYPSDLIQSSNGGFLGTTYNGGGGPDSGGGGTVFAFTTHILTSSFSIPLITVTGSSNDACQVQATTNLASSWSTITNLVLTNGQMQLTDLSATNYPQRFYRTVKQQ